MNSQEQELNELFNQYDEFLKLESSIAAAKEKTFKETIAKECSTPLNVYITVSEDGVPKIHDKAYGFYDFSNVKEAYEFYEMLREADPDNLEYRLLAFELKALNSPFNKEIYDPERDKRAHVH